MDMRRIGKIAVAGLCLLGLALPAAAGKKNPDSKAKDAAKKTPKMIVISGKLEAEGEADALKDLRLVTADGVVYRLDADEKMELFIKTFLGRTVEVRGLPREEKEGDGKAMYLAPKGYRIVLAGTVAVQRKGEKVLGATLQAGGDTYELVVTKKTKDLLETADGKSVRLTGGAAKPRKTKEGEEALPRVMVYSYEIDENAAPAPAAEAKDAPADNADGGEKDEGETL